MKWIISGLLVVFLFLSGCGGGGSGGDSVEPEANIAPVADAGADQMVTTGATVYLNGDGTDSDDDSLTYRWRLDEKPIGSDAELSFNNIANPVFVTDIDGTYTVELAVNDGTVDSLIDVLVVTATTANIAPIANAGIDQTVITGNTVYLDGNNSSDANDDDLTYSWSMASPAGSSAILLFSASTGLADFTPDVDGIYVLQLVVNDGAVDSLANIMLVTADANVAPVADAGIDQAVLTGNTVYLDGNNSNDVNDDDLTYDWNMVRPAGSSAILLFSASTGLADFTPDVDGVYTVQLVVNDGVVDSLPDTVLVAANTNVAPVANVGADQVVITGVNVHLDGSGSSDANDDDLTYDWSMVRPVGSSAILFFSTSTGLADFTPDVDGVYTVQLVVNDGAVDSPADTLVVTATPNVAPLADAGADQTVTTGIRVWLDGGGSTDANGDELTYDWSITRPEGSLVILFFSGSIGQFTPDIDGSYTIGLIVNDGLVDSAPDTMVVTSQ